MPPSPRGRGSHGPDPSGAQGKASPPGTWPSDRSSDPDVQGRELQWTGTTAGSVALVVLMGMVYAVRAPDEYCRLSGR